MNLDDIIEINNMLDAYGKFLTQKQFEVMDFYYKQNYSLSEIAETLGITRQAVNFSIKQSLDTLNEFEEKLHLVKIKKVLLDENDCELKNKILSIMEE